MLQCSSSSAVVGAAQDMQAQGTNGAALPLDMQTAICAGRVISCPCFDLCRQDYILLLRFVQSELYPGRIAIWYDRLSTHRPYSLLLIVLLQFVQAGFVQYHMRLFALLQNKYVKRACATANRGGNSGL
jgi:hypothetical protein